MRLLLAPAMAMVVALPASYEQHAAPPRVGRPGFVYDPVRQVTVLFGGVSDENAYPGTWEWNGAEWRERTIAGPPARANHGMVYDARRRVMVVFGGEAPDGHALGDTWEYDGTSWRRVAESGPSPRAGFASAYDEARGLTVIHGGFAGRSEHSCSDTWGWNGARWTKAAVTGPPPRDHHAMAYDGRARRVVVFGGGRQLPGGGYDRARLWLNDLWAWDGERWTLLSAEGPASRGGQPGLTYDAARDRLVLFGGGMLEGTWEWNGSRWERRR